MGDGGKGSRQRPTDKNKFDRNWNTIFNKPKIFVKEKQINNQEDSTVDKSQKDKYI
jgi:hypothetical protein